jgi:hypothetical protein
VADPSVQKCGDFSQSQMRPLKLIGSYQLGDLAGVEFINLVPDVSKVPLEVFLHGTALAVPFGTLIKRWRQPIIGSTEKISSQRHLHQRTVRGCAGITRSDSGPRRNALWVCVFHALWFQCQEAPILHHA